MSAFSHSVDEEPHPDYTSNPIASGSTNKLNTAKRVQQRHTYEREQQQRQRQHPLTHIHPQHPITQTPFLLPSNLSILQNNAGDINTRASSSSSSTPASPALHAHSHLSNPNSNPDNSDSPSNSSSNFRSINAHSPTSNNSPSNPSPSPSPSNSNPSISNHSHNSNSPYSPHTPQSASEPTSDEQPDLGAFTTVFREWTHLGIAAAQRGQMGMGVGGGLGMGSNNNQRLGQSSNMGLGAGHGLSLNTGTGLRGLQGLYETGMGAGMRELGLSELSAGAVGGSVGSVMGGSAVEGVGEGVGVFFGFLREGEGSSREGSVVEREVKSTTPSEFASTVSEEFEIVGPLEGFQQRNQVNSMGHVVTRTSSYNSQQSHQTHHSNRSTIQTPSSFTRPPSSSAQETTRSESIMEGSTVWVHPPIANYLLPSTPSMERMQEEDEDGASDQSCEHEGETSGDEDEDASMDGDDRDSYEQDNTDARPNIDEFNNPVISTRPQHHAPPISRASFSQSTVSSAFSNADFSDVTDAMTVEIVSGPSVVGVSDDQESEDGDQDQGLENRYAEEEERHEEYGYVGIQVHDEEEEARLSRSSVTSRDIHIITRPSVGGKESNSEIIIHNESPSASIRLSTHSHSHSQHTSPQLISQGRIQTTGEISSPISLPRISISSISGDGDETRPSGGVLSIVSEAQGQGDTTKNHELQPNPNVISTPSTLSSSVSSHNLHIHPLKTTLSTTSPSGTTPTHTHDAISRSTSTSISPSNSTLIRQFPSPPNTHSNSPFVVGGVLGYAGDGQRQGHAMGGYPHSNNVNALLALPSLQTRHHRRQQSNSVVKDMNKANVHDAADLDPRSPAARSHIPYISTEGSTPCSIGSGMSVSPVPVPPIPGYFGNEDGHPRILNQQLSIPRLSRSLHLLNQSHSTSQPQISVQVHSHLALQSHIPIQTHPQPIQTQTRRKSSRHTRTLSDPSNDSGASFSLGSHTASSETISLLTYQGGTPLIGGGESRGVQSGMQIVQQPIQRTRGFARFELDPRLDDGAFVEDSSPAMREPLLSYHSRSASHSPRSHSRSRSRSISHSPINPPSPHSPPPSPDLRPRHESSSPSVMDDMGSRHDGTTPTPEPQVVKISTTPMSMTTNGSGVGDSKGNGDVDDESEDGDEDRNERRGGEEGTTKAEGRRVRIVGGYGRSVSRSDMGSVGVSVEGDERSVSISGMGSVSLKTQMSLKSVGESEEEEGGVYVDSGTSHEVGRSQEEEGSPDEVEGEDEDGSSDVTPSYIAERENIPVQEGRHQQQLPQLHHPHAMNPHNLRNALLVRPMTGTSMATSGVGGSPLPNPYSPLIVGVGGGGGHDEERNVLGHVVPLGQSGYLGVRGRPRQQAMTTTARPNLRLKFGDITGVDEMDEAGTPGQLSTLSLAFETPLHLKSRGLESDGGGREKSEKSKGKRRQKQSGGYDVVDDTEDEDNTSQGRSSHVLTNMDNQKAYNEQTHQQQHNVPIIQTQPHPTFILSSIPSTQSLSQYHPRSHAHYQHTNPSMSASTLTHYTDTHSSSTTTAIPALSHSISSTLPSEAAVYELPRTHAPYVNYNPTTTGVDTQASVQHQQQVYNPMPSRVPQGPGPVQSREEEDNRDKEVEEEDDDEDDSKSSSSSNYALLQYPYPSSSSEASVGRSKRGTRRVKKEDARVQERDMVLIKEEGGVGGETISGMGLESAARMVNDEEDVIGSGGRTPTYYWDKDRSATRAIEERYQAQMSQSPPGRVQRDELVQQVYHQGYHKPGSEATSRYVLVPFQEQDYEPEPRGKPDDVLSRQKQEQPQTQTRSRPLPPLPKSTSTSGSVMSSGTGTLVQRVHVAQAPLQAPSQTQTHAQHTYNARPGYVTNHTATSVSSRLGSLDTVSGSVASSNVVSPTTSESTSAVGSVGTVTARYHSYGVGHEQGQHREQQREQREPSNAYTGSQVSYSQQSQSGYGHQQQHQQRLHYPSKDTPVHRLTDTRSQPLTDNRPQTHLKDLSQPLITGIPTPNMFISPVPTPNTFISPMHTPNTFIGTVSSGDVMGALPSVGGSVGTIGTSYCAGGSFRTITGSESASSARGRGVTVPSSGSSSAYERSLMGVEGAIESNTTRITAHVGVGMQGDEEQDREQDRDGERGRDRNGDGGMEEGYTYNDRTVTHSRKGSEPSMSVSSVEGASRSNVATDGGDTVSILSVESGSAASMTSVSVLVGRGGGGNGNGVRSGLEDRNKEDEEDMASGARTHRPLVHAHPHPHSHPNPQSQSQIPSHIHAHPLHPSNDHELSLESPSLGYLDEALRFIAAERAERERMNKERAAARVAAGSGSGSGARVGGEEERERDWEEEEEWEEYDYEFDNGEGHGDVMGRVDYLQRVYELRDGNENERTEAGGQEPRLEQSETPQPKKKRKRKRPIRAHAAAAMAAAAAAASGSDVLVGSTGYLAGGGGGSAGSAAESRGKSKANVSVAVNNSKTNASTTAVTLKLSNPNPNPGTEANTRNVPAQPNFLEPSEGNNGVGIGGGAASTEGLGNASFIISSPAGARTTTQYLGSPATNASQHLGSPGFDGSASASLLGSPAGTKKKGVSGGGGGNRSSKVKGKEREFLVATQQPVYTILKRPSVEGGGGRGPGGGLLVPPTVSGGGHDSEDDGAQTPRGVFLKSRGGDDERGKGQENQHGIVERGVSFVENKGDRIGRRERERIEEEVRFEGVQAEAGDNDDDGSLDGLSLLQPPQRDGHRKKDTAYIHTITSGAYKSTPGSPRNRLADLEDASFEDDGSNISIKVEGMESDQFEQEQYQDQQEQRQGFGTMLDSPAIKPEKEKRKRVRTKRDKGLARVASVPDLPADANAVTTKAVGGEGSGGSKPASVKPKKSKSKIVEPTPVDMLHMDRSESSAIFPAPSSSSMRQASARLLRQQALQLDTAVAAAGISSSQQEPSGPQTKRGRLVGLAKKLRQLFPEQHKELGSVIQRLERQGSDASNSRTRATGVDNISSASGSGPSSGFAVPGSATVGGSGVKRKRSRKNRSFRMASGPDEETGVVGGGEAEEDRFESGIGPGSSIYPINATPGTTRRFLEVQEEQGEELDPRGRVARQGDVLVHVFIDHSNILVGLLSHLKRNRPRKYVAGRYVTSHMGRSITIVDPKDTASSRNRIETAGVAYTGDPPVPIPLPSFATASRSLPSSSVLKSVMKGTAGNISEREINSDGYEDPTEDMEEAEDVEFDADVSPSEGMKPRKTLRHLWHAALTLVLERGRPVTRRVVVASSPLHQPMEGIKDLGYELRVFMRVPDMGDGMDRERHRDKEKSGKSSLSSPAASNAPYLSSSSSSKKTGRQLLGHVRHLSGSTSADSGSGSGGNNLHNAVGVNATGTTGSIAPPPKIKYREQGVDELLQLKLHQALAATDDVPPGSTIVLATGDGNMGQFNEDGFLGPVRTALKRGWHVELYAWEDGLSRAWRREFGDNDMFRIIAMEQFANTLVESPEW